MCYDSLSSPSAAVTLLVEDTPAPPRPPQPPWPCRMGTRPPSVQNSPSLKYIHIFIHQPGSRPSTDDGSGVRLLLLVIEDTREGAQLVRKCTELGDFVRRAAAMEKACG